MNPKPSKILITGGVRSGKSRYAVNRALNYAVPRVYLATAETFDDGMRERIAKHQAERKSDFLTVEEPLDLAGRIENLEFQPAVVLIDCLTVWVNNLIYHFGEKDLRIQKAIQDLMQQIEGSKLPVILVTNEIGLGVMPENALARHYIDQLGTLNQSMASICDEVILIVAWIPQRLKGVGSRAYVDQPVTKY